MKIDLKEKELGMLCHALDQLILNWSNLGVDVGEHWFILRDKMLKNLKGGAKKNG